MIYAQWYLIIHIIIVALVRIYYDINGWPVKKPMGFIGVFSTLIAISLNVYIFYIAGAFSKIF